MAARKVGYNYPLVTERIPRMMAKIPREVFEGSSSGLKGRRERTGDKERW